MYSDSYPEILCAGRSIALTPELYRNTLLARIFIKVGDYHELFT